MAKDDPELDALQDMMNNMVKYGFIAVSIVQIFAEFCTLTVLFLAMKRGTLQDMRLRVKVSLFWYAICLPCYIFYFLYYSFGGDVLSQASTMGIALIVNMWFCLHWLYCNMYLQTACLFRGTF